MSLARAVDFAAAMLRKGEAFGTAVTIASRHYGVEWRDVQRGLSSRSGRSQAGKRRPRPRYPARSCDVCYARPATWKGAPYAGSLPGVVVFTCDACGQRLPDWYETDRRNPITRISWATYRVAEDL